MALVLKSPGLQPIWEAPSIDDQLDALSDKADGASSHVGSLIHSAVNSTLSDSKKSGMTGGNFSAFTAPSRYRNSGVFVHGTKFRNFEPIMKQGLKAAKSDIFMIDEVRPDGRVPGLQEPPEILIFIDEEKARSQMMEFDYDGKEGTWKTKGINGVIRPWFFQKVVDQRKCPGRGNVLFQSKEDPIMQANVLKGKQRPQYLLHATFWENVPGIMQEGIVPAKNPISSFRQPFKELLQGAESHVYTISSHVLDKTAAEMLCDIGVNTCSTKAARREALKYRLNKETVGLERAPDAFVVIDTSKAQGLGMVQSADREDCVYVRGPVPVAAIAAVEANEPVDLPNDLKASVPHLLPGSGNLGLDTADREPVKLPDDLKAKIVDPRSFSEIPIIDLRKDEAENVEAFRYACEVVGFMQVVGHGVPEELQQKLMEKQRRFFNLPEHVKRRLSLHEGSPVRGYFGRGGEDLDQVVLDKVDSAAGKKIAQQSRKDHKESLDTNGVPWSRPQGGYVAEIFGQPSRLPTEEELPGLREVLEEYAQEMFGLSKKILSFLARVLGKEPNFFDQYLTNPVATHRLLHYWPTTDFKTQIGVGAHTDYGLITILKQDAVGGLQVLNYKDFKWIHCCPIKDAFVVNLGDMMGRWTAHRFKSTVHRVVNISPLERYSVPYFLEPNMDTRIVHGGLCDGSGSGGRLLAPAVDPAPEGQRLPFRPPLRSPVEAPTAEELLERFYRASGQLKHGPGPLGAPPLAPGAERSASAA